MGTPLHRLPSTNNRASLGNVWQHVRRIWCSPLANRKFSKIYPLVRGWGVGTQGGTETGGEGRTNGRREGRLEGRKEKTQGREKRRLTGRREGRNGGRSPKTKQSFFVELPLSPGTPPKEVLEVVQELLGFESLRETPALFNKIAEQLEVVGH